MAAILQEGSLHLLPLPIPSFRGATANEPRLIEHIDDLKHIDDDLQKSGTSSEIRTQLGSIFKDNLLGIPNNDTGSFCEL